MTSAAEQRESILATLTAAEAKLAATRAGAWVADKDSVFEAGLSIRRRYIALTIDNATDAEEQREQERERRAADAAAICLTRNTYGALLTGYREMLPTAEWCDEYDRCAEFGPTGVDIERVANLTHIARAADAIAAELAKENNHD